MSDLALIELGPSFRLEPKSLLGLLWLQTHFESQSWDLICSGQARLSAGTRVALCSDAAAAGLQVSCLAAPKPVAG